MISPDQNRHIVDWLHERGFEFYLESNNGLFASEPFGERGEPVTKLHAARKGKDNAGKTIVHDAFATMIFNEKLYRDDLNKAGFILENYQDYLDAKTEISDFQTGTWGGIGETALFGDLGVKNITKAHDIDMLLKYLDIDKKIRLPDNSMNSKRILRRKHRIFSSKISRILMMTFPSSFPSAESDL